MSITVKESAFVATNAVSVLLSQMFTVTAATSDPAYLVLSALDRNEYTAGSTGATGSLSGNGQTLGLTSIGGDARSAGIVFTYQASTGRYYNSTYGYLDQMTYNSSASTGDVTNLSLFGTASLSVANAYASSTYALVESDAAGYIGSATVVTQPKFTATVPVQATPDSIAATADSFIGQAWNSEGCWTLASTIAADAGASLPVQTTLIGLPGPPNGEWIVAFNGPSGQAGNWQSLVTAGEVIVFETQSGGGHVTTCVSGSGSTAMLVDNIVYTNSSGQILNPANDGSSNDVLVSAAHLASLEWAGVMASSVIIYELDTPVVTANVASDTLSFLASAALAPLFTAVDPANNAITQWQVYDTAASDTLLDGGVDYQDHSSASALTVASLAAVSLLAGSTLTTDTLEVRAYNGTYWGDWDPLSVAVVATAPPPPAAAPVLAAQTANQTWVGGTAIRLALPAATFRDPQSQALVYTALLSTGQALPAWLTFNAATETFTGTPPTTAQTLSIVVTATDTSGLSATDTFSANILGAPVQEAVTPNQTWVEGSAISLVLASNTFVDPQSQTLTYGATQSNGQALPSWLSFNTATETFSGTAPATAQNLGITVTATDTSGLAASETFTAIVQSPATVIRPGIAVTAQTPNQTWTDGLTETLVLPANTFTDALGLNMTFAAYQVSGPSVVSWLRFGAVKDQFVGTVPLGTTGTVQIAVIAMDQQFMMAVDLFSITFASATSHSASSIQTQATAPFNPSHLTGLLAFPEIGSRAPAHHATIADPASLPFHS